LRVLITGGAGFLGSHLAERLVADGHRVTAVDDLSTGRLGNLTEARKSKGLYVHRFDITEPGLRELIVREQPEVVCHLAARRSADPVRDAAVNVGGTVNLLEACIAGHVDRVLLASDGAAVYAPAAKPVTERAGVAPRSPYGASKVAAESYLQSYGIGGAVLRLGTLYGTRSNGGVVARFANALTHSATGTVFGDGSTRRDLVHVDDAVDAFLRCLGGKADGRRLNIGSGTSTSVRRLHTLVARAAGAPDAPNYAAPRPGEAPFVALDSSGARRLLGWETTVALADGLREVVEWQGQQPRKR